MILVVALSLLGSLVTPVSADEPAKPASGGKTVSTMFIGEGGSYQDPNSDAKDYYQHGAPGMGIPGAGPSGSAPAQAPAGQAETAPAAQRPRDAFIPRDPASIRRDQSAQPPAPESAPAAHGADDRKRYSLWEGIAAPLALPSNKIKDATVDQASQMGRHDYDGDRSGPAGVSASGTAKPAAGSGLALAGVNPSAAQGETFVTVDFALKGAQLKDAVAGLAGVAGFRQDMRFAPVFSGPAKARASVSGWLPLSRVGEAMKSSLVQRIQTQEGVSLATLSNPPPLPVDGPVSQVIVGIRVRDRSAVDETLTRVTRELAEQSGFHLTETVGIQPVPGSKDLALVVVGSVSSRELSRLMAHPDVLKVLPAPGATPAQPGSAPPTPGKKVGFLSFVKDRAPMLLVVTLLLLVASVADRMRWGRLFEFFVPYRR